MKLDPAMKNDLIKIIKNDKQLPQPYKNILFKPEEKQMEYELIYGNKERKEDILAETMSLPFQIVKKFGKAKENEWQNKLIFGDNLQVLKYLKKQQDEGKLEKIKLIYIDPPFGTGDIYDAKGAPAYSAALQGADFLEFLRKRLVFLRELLSDDGSIYVRIDYHFGHYVKVIMDEIFGKNNFRNEIIVNRRKKSAQETNRFNVSTELLLFYTKSDNFLFHKGNRSRICSFCGHEKEPEWHIMISSGIRHPPERNILGKKMLPPKGFHWTYSQENIDKMTLQKRIRINEKASYIDLNGNRIKGMPEYLQASEIPIDSNWTDIYGYTSKWKYPTENAEEILKRVVETSSDEGDIILDCFAGSGTAGSVAEKLGRRWIMVDCSKLSIYTIIKRMHSLKEGIGNVGKSIDACSFVLYNAGLYEDHEHILKIGEDKYRNFAMELFQVEPKDDYEINALKMDGSLLNSPVKVFSQKGFLTEKYIDELHAVVGESIRGRMFLIAPASRVYFLQDYIEKDGVRYYILRIPYSVIDEIHKVAFSRPTQPKSLSELNKNIDSIGFDFIHPPKVKVSLFRQKPKNKLTGYGPNATYDYKIKINDFEAIQRSKEPIKFEDPKDAISMVMIDVDYNGEFFKLDHYFFADEIKKNEWIITFSEKNVGDKIMIIYIDVLGNEKRELLQKSKFKVV